MKRFFGTIFFCVIIGVWYIGISYLTYGGWAELVAVHRHLPVTLLIVLSCLTAWFLIAVLHTIVPIVLIFILGMWYAAIHFLMNGGWAELTAMNGTSLPMVFLSIIIMITWILLIVFKIIND